MVRATNKTIGLLYSDSESNWISCQSITPNLVSAYREVFKNADLKHFRMPKDSSGNWPLAREIHAIKPSHLIFVDHLPHPDVLLSNLTEFYGGEKLPEITIHVYGDFTLYPEQWINCARILKKTKVRFICASPRQESLVRTFLADAAPGSTAVSPFPVDTRVFQFDKSSREAGRKRLGISPDEKAIVYSGRLSLQKNITRLMKEIYRLPHKKLRFFLAGPFDELGAPLFGIRQLQGSYFQYWSEVLNSFPVSFQKRVHYLGDLDAEELAELLNAADLFASLSLHHDEDFGMAPAEALCCGNPTLLSDWGGYASFAGSERDCALIPVRLGNRGPQISTDFSRLACGFLNAGEEAAERQKRSAKYAERVSIGAVTRNLEKIMAKPAPAFEGFSWIMESHAKNIKTAVPFGELGRGSLYEGIYGNYTVD